MLKKEEFSTKIFIEENKALFEEVMEDFKLSNPKMKTMYTMLDYTKILNEMAEFITGFIEYKRKNDDKYRNKLFGTTKYYYDNMFVDTVRYRKDIHLNEIKDINKQFLLGTKNIQDLMDELSEQESDPEYQQILIMTNNQYRKISRVYKDDMEIFKWLTTEHKISAKLRADFEDESTPVMHLKKKEVNDS